MRQLPLDLALPPRFGRDDYLPDASNAAALALLDRWPDWPDRVLLLLGPGGAGKSHLAALWAERAAANRIAPADLDEPAQLATMAASPAVLEDADRLGGREAALFHLLNLVRGGRSFLLMTARQPPEFWGLRLADLTSRLRLAPQAVVPAPDEALLRAVLVKLFSDRQIAVDETVVAYLALHLGRSIGAARQAVEALDREGLARHRRVTRAMAAEVLQSLRLDED